MINVLTKFYSLISAIVTRTYHKGAEDKTVFPYATYSCPTINGVGNYTQGRDDVFLEIDIWDNDSDETTLETLTRAVDVALNGLRYSDNNIKIRLDKLSILDLPDPDETINHRQIRFRVITYQFVAQPEHPMYSVTILYPSESLYPADNLKPDPYVRIN